MRIHAIRGAKFIPSHVGVSFFADLFTEKTVEVPIVGIGFPRDKQLKTFPSKVNVTFQVGLSQFKSVTASDCSIVVAYKELTNDKTDKCKLKLSTIPYGVSHVRISPDIVDYLIEQIIINEPDED